MGQLAERLRELIRRYGGDDRLWQPDLDALSDLERSDFERAHARFVEWKRGIATGRFQDLKAELRRVPWLVDLPSDEPDDYTERQLDRAIEALEAALRRARDLEAAVDEARGHVATLRERAAIADFSPLERVPFADLGRAADVAEALRRAAAREARVEARYRDARARAARLKAAPVAVPDLSSAAVPDADAASATLDDVEARLKDAERVEDARGRVERALRDHAVKEFTAARRKALARRADEEAALADRAAAARALEASAAEAEALRTEAAALAREAARARKRGLKGPDRERRAGDLQDYYG